MLDHSIPHTKCQPNPLLGSSAGLIGLSRTLIQMTTRLSSAPIYVSQKSKYSRLVDNIYNKNIMK